jgi:predicted SprT family Zn-dependent metalloprotease
MTNQQNEGGEKNRIYKCELLCGRIAKGVIKTSEKTDLYLCDTCRRTLDPGEKSVWIPY